MIYTIYDLDGAVRHEIEAASFRDAIVATRNDLSGARLHGFSLSYLDLRRAILRRAVLNWADCTGADLTEADLSEADARGATLRGAVLRGADLRYSDLTGADLTEADFTGAAMRFANLSGAILRGAIGLPDAPVVANLDAAILARLDSGKYRLDMQSGWHTCGTTHCQAGHAIDLAGPAGYALEDRFGPSVAGALIYFASTGRVPDFYASNEDALDDMRAHALGE